MTKRKPPPRPEWATEIPCRTTHTFKVHNTLSHAKTAINQRAGRAWTPSIPYNDRPIQFQSDVKLWRWVDEDWQLMFEAHQGDLWNVPWTSDPNWGK